MRIAILGAGALGAYFGARLHAAGIKVALIARGAHLEAIRQHGLYVDSPNGNLHLTDIEATDDPREIGVVDYVLAFVKNYDLAQALQQAQPMIGENTCIATFQNGITAPSVAAEMFGADRVLGGAAWIPGYISAPGRIKHTDTKDTLTFGAMNAEGRRFEQPLFDALTAAGTRPEISDDIEAALWMKFVMLAATSAVSALTRLTFGEVNQHPKTKDLMLQAIHEAAEVALSVRPDLPQDLAAQQMGYYENINGQVRASMCTDLLNGRRLELDWFSGQIMRLGQEHGIATPVHQIALAALWPYRDGPAV